MGRKAILRKPQKAREARTKAGYYCDVYKKKGDNNIFLEVHYYHCGHQSIRKFIWTGTFYLRIGENKLQRVNKATLKETIDDFTLISSYHKHQEA